MTPHIPEEFPSWFINRSPFAIMGNTCRPEILMKTTRTKRKRKRTVPTNRRSCASRTKTSA